ncbi:hypothetical protein [Longitalea arenae]|uniref:hypothetical protein n=1 Tax=Longitalea arenae TaxID=2812558 RepID=UPI0019680816|nr:hypothetical protein [Longitalea arenae]
MVKIYCTNNSELAEFEASSRGYRSDIFVKLDSGAIYQVNVYDIVRLKQDFEEEIDSEGYFSIEPNLILVKEVVMSQIRLTIEKLVKQKFFDYLKPIHESEVDVNKLVEV